MKTKLIGLAAITLALVMTMGIASATQICPFIMNSKIGVSGAAGGADHELEIFNSYFTKLNHVQISNINISTDCSVLDFNAPGIFGSGTITTAYGLLKDGRTFQFEQTVAADKAVREDMEYISASYCDPIRFLGLATEGRMDSEEIVTITTTGSVITGLSIVHNATLNATAVGGTSIVESIFEAPALGVTKTSSACGAEAGYYFSILMPPSQ
jgi:hypothetical protein